MCSYNFRKQGQNAFFLVLMCIFFVFILSCSDDDSKTEDSSQTGTDNNGPGSNHPGSNEPGSTDSAQQGTNGGGSSSTDTSTPPVEVIPGAACALTESLVRITEINVGQSVSANEAEATLRPIMISPVPGGGSRVAWMGEDNHVHVTTLDQNDQIIDNSIRIPVNDFGDIYATAQGGVLLVTRDATGGGTLNCGNPNNLCGTPPNPPVPCHDMYMVGFNQDGEQWATKLTDSSAQLPPYSTGPTGDSVIMIWWYAHHGRIASDGNSFAAFYGAAISVSEGGCINIHQGDRMDVVSTDGTRQNGGFRWGCSHSGYERVIWDPRANEYVAICLNDRPTEGESGKIAFAPRATTILPVDLWYSNLANLVAAPAGGYWLAFSYRQDSQPVNANGLAQVNLMRFTQDTIENTVVVADDAALNQRAPHLAAYGTDGLLVAWETSSSTGNLGARTNDRRFYIQARDAQTGGPIGDPYHVADITGNRYHELRAFPDGSVAYASVGSSNNTIKILRVLSCQ